MHVRNGLCPQTFDSSATVEGMVCRARQCRCLLVYTWEDVLAVGVQHNGQTKQEAVLRGKGRGGASGDTTAAGGSSNTRQGVSGSPAGLGQFTPGNMLAWHTVNGTVTRGNSCTACFCYRSLLMCTLLLQPIIKVTPLPIMAAV